MDLFADCKGNIIKAQEQLYNVPNYQIKKIDNNLSVAFIPIIPEGGFSIYSRPSPDGFREVWYFLILNGLVISSCTEYLIDCKVYTIEEYRNKGYTRKFIKFLYDNYQMPFRVTCIMKRTLSLFKDIDVKAHVRTIDDIKYEKKHFQKIIKVLNIKHIL